MTWCLGGKFYNFLYVKQLLINLDKCNGCRDCEVACAAKQSGTLKLLKRNKDGKLWHPRISLTPKPVPGTFISVERLKVQGSRLKALIPYPLNIKPLISDFRLPTSDFYLPLLCLHCDDAPCLEACISGAMRRDKKTGLVNVDREQCVGCWSCIMVCPFGIINRGKSAGRQPARLRHSGGFALKCDGCPDLPEPACVKFCEPKALAFLPLNEFTKSIRRNVLKRRLHPHFVTLTPSRPAGGKGLRDSSLSLR